MHIEQILFDPDMWEKITNKAETFFYTAVLPELVGKFYTRIPGVGNTPFSSQSLPKNPVNNEDNTEECWCYCDQVESGRMICCDNENCSIVWFPLTYLKLTDEPKGKMWYCQDCRKLPQFTRKRRNFHD